MMIVNLMLISEDDDCQLDIDQFHNAVLHLSVPCYDQFYACQFMLDQLHAMQFCLESQSISEEAPNLL